MEKRVYIVLLNYNSANHTKECVESILNCNYSNVCIIIVDNKSSDNSKEFLSGALSSLDRRFKIIDENEKNNYLNDNDIALMISSENNGFASGNNKALKYICEMNVDGFVWVLNNDTVIDKNSIKELVNSTTNKKCFTGSTLIDYKNKKTIQTFGGFKLLNIIGTPRKIYKNIDVNELKLVNKNVELDMLSGASIFMNIETLKEVGLMPEEYFMYWEDADWCMIAKSKGISMEVCSDSLVYHKEGGSIGLRSKRQMTLDFKNTLMFYRKYNCKYIKYIIIFKILINVISTIKNKGNVIDTLNASREGIKQFKDGKINV